MKNKINLENKTILATDSSGFVGVSIAKRLLNKYQTSTFIGLDNMNEYYDIRIKKSRIK